MTLSVGSRLGHYVLGAPLGTGGMGEVYRATDTKLGREVALKVLPADVASSPDRLERFRREARAVAALNHPHIVTIYSVEEAEGVHFLTMELVEGQPLDRYIPAGGLPVPRILEIAGAIADALAAAHAKGIVHRDLKPANVMVTDERRVKVLDFGLAKVAGEDAHGESMATVLQTRDGVVLGTVPYMSPEQIAGRTVDHRSDIFSFGIIVYEMACGRRPFDGASSIELGSAILRDTPPPLTNLRSDMPADLVRLIDKCLEKDPRSRVQHARDVGAGLRDLARRTDPIASVRTSTAPTSGTLRAEDGFWVAVLPFKARGSEALQSLAEGLTEDIVTGLSRFSYLRVIARSSTARYASDAIDVRSAGKELGARYVMDGSLRQAGARLRLAVQLVDASSGAHLWAETYDRAFRDDAVFDLQDDLVPRIVATVADTQGVLIRTMSRALRSKNPDDMSLYEAVMRSMGYYERMNPEEHAEVRAVLERALERTPGSSDAWAVLSMLYGDEYRNGFNPRPDSLRRALDAARRAVAAEPSNAFASITLASVLFFLREMHAFRSAAERALSLNPMDAAGITYIGSLLAYAGDWERGSALVDRARQVNPQIPGWCWFVDFFNAYRQADYRAALDAALKADLPGYFLAAAARAVSYGQLGDREAAASSLRELLTQRPDIGAVARAEFGKWFDADLVEHMIDGLRKAGLDVPSVERVRAASSVTASAEPLGARPDAASIAVLPFVNSSDDPEKSYFGDGLAEELLNALSQIDGLHVAARTSSFSFKGKTVEVGEIAAKLRVATVLEGSVRVAGNRVRVTVQLVDARTGFHLWSERFDRQMEDIFAVQDEIARAIAARLRVSFASGGESQPTRAPTRHTGAYELYLKGRAFLYQRGPSVFKAIDCFTEAVGLDSSYAQAWAGLADSYTVTAQSGYKPGVEALPKALEAARQALRLDPDLAEAHSALACATVLYERNDGLAEQEFRRALELNPRYSQGRAWYGLWFLQWIAGREAEGREEVARMLEIDPLSSYAHVTRAFSDFTSGRLTEGVEHARRSIDLDRESYVAHWCHLTALHHAGRYADAVAAGERTLALFGRHGWTLAVLAMTFSAWQKPDQARALYNELDARRTREYVQPFVMTSAAAAVGLLDEAIASVQQALDQRDPLLVMSARWWAGFDPLRSDPSFHDIVRQLRLPRWDQPA